MEKRPGRCICVCFFPAAQSGSDIAGLSLSLSPLSSLLSILSPFSFSLLYAYIPAVLELGGDAAIYEDSVRGLKERAYRGDGRGTAVMRFMQRQEQQQLVSYIHFDKS